MIKSKWLRSWLTGRDFKLWLDPFTINVLYEGTILTTKYQTDTDPGIPRSLLGA